MNEIFSEWYSGLMANFGDGVIQYFAKMVISLKPLNILRFCYLIKEMLLCIFSTKPLKNSCRKIGF